MWTMCILFLRTRGKDKVNVTFRAAQGKNAGGLYELKITSDTNYR